MSAHEQAGEVAAAALAQRWLNQCGPCDGGLPMECVCPNEDPRPVIANLLDRLERAEDAVAAIRDALDPEELVCGRLGLTCIDVNPLRSYCRPCRLHAALTGVQA